MHLLAIDGTSNRRASCLLILTRQAGAQRLCLKHNTDIENESILSAWHLLRCKNSVITVQYQERHSNNVAITEASGNSADSKSTREHTKGLSIMASSLSNS